MAARHRAVQPPGALMDADLDPNRVTYTPLAFMPTATEKVRRGAPAIAVCEASGPCWNGA